MIKYFVFAMALCGASAFAAPQSPLSFGIDCMIHDAKGAMVADLGMVGKMMDGSYMSSNRFPFDTLMIEANLEGPFAETPEVAAPQLKLTVVDSKGALQASTVVNANMDLNIALLIPVANVYLHCDKMSMGHH